MSISSWEELPLDCGDPAGEHAALVGAGAFFDVAAGFFRVQGPDACDFLQGQVGADIASLQPGEGAWSLSLTPKGTLIAPTVVYALSGEDFLFVCNLEALDALVGALRRFLLRVKAEITVLPGMRARVLLGPAVGQLLQDTFAVCPGKAAPEITGLVEGFHGLDGLLDSPDTVFLARLPEGGLGDFFLCEPGRNSASDAFLAEAGELLRYAEIVPVGRAALDGYRVERALPVFGVDYGPDIVPHDAGLVPRAVSLSKGCYVGQELIERVHTRGNPALHVQTLRFTGDTASFEEETREVLEDGVSLGRLTTTAFCPEWGVVGGMGLLKRKAVPGAAVTVAGVSAVLLAGGESA